MDIRILIIDDEVSILEIFSIFFESLDFFVNTASSYNEAVDLIENNDYNVIVTDLKLGKKSGINILEYVNKLKLSIPVILMTAYASKETALKASELGIYDYLTKPVDLDKLSVVIKRAYEKYILLRELKKLKKNKVLDLIGSSELFLKAIDTAKRVAQTDINVLITGESGTGKELFAKLIHEYSSRAKEKFIPLNCGAIPENLIESELFGYTKGAFTGANTDKEGIFVVAEKGSVFLDEIGELPLLMQPKLLRVLQEQKIKKIGTHIEKNIDTRIIAATNKDLLKEIKDNKFREDLYYRLNVINIKLPSLRERKEDIPDLVNYFINEFNNKYNKNIKGASADLINYFLNYDFPGNLRELKNIIDRLCVLENEEILTKKYLSQNNKINTFDEKVNLPVKLDEVLENLEREYLIKALEKSKGIKKEAAKLLNISFRSLRYRIEKHKLEI